MKKVNIVDIAVSGPVTVEQLRAQLDKLPAYAVVAIGSCCGVHLYNGKPEQELARFQSEDKDRTVRVDHFPELEQDPDDDQLLGERQEVVILR